MRLNRNSFGLTLIEVIVYVGITAFVATALAQVLVNAQRSTYYQDAIREVGDQGAYIQALITDELKAANSITTPATDNLSGASLVFC